MQRCMQRCMQDETAAGIPGKRARVGWFDYELKWRRGVARMPDDEMRDPRIKGLNEA